VSHPRSKKPPIAGPFLFSMPQNLDKFYGGAIIEMERKRGILSKTAP